MVADKLVLIIRSDLRPGQQAVQAAHVAHQFSVDHPTQFKSWFEQSNTLTLLSVSDEKTLRQLVDKADDLDLRVSVFREPDFGNALTAVALEPGPQSRKLCRNLSLALGG